MENSMAEFTRSIEQLQQTSASQPQFAQPAQTLGQDIVNLASTGLDFYAKNKAEEQLKIQLKAQAEQEKMFNKGVLGYRQLREQLKGQGLSRTQIMKKENDYLKQFDETTRVGIISGTNKLTGQTTADVTEASEKAILDRQKQRQTLESDLAELEPYLPRKVDLNAPDDELRTLKLQGDIAKARLDKKKSEAALRSTQLSNETSQRKLDAEVFAIEYGARFGAAYAQSVEGIMETANFNDPSSVQELININSTLRSNMITEGVKNAAQSGIVISQNDLEEKLSAQLDIFDATDRFLKRDDIATMSKNQRTYKTNNLILALQSSENPKERKLGKLVTLIDALGENAPLTQEFTKMFSGAMVQGFGADIYGFGEDGADLDTSKKTVKDIFKNADANTPEDSKDAYTEVILSDLTGSQTTRDRVLSNGGFTTYVEGIATGNPDNVIAADKKEEVLVALMDNSEQFLRRAIPKVLQEEQLLGFEKKYDRRGKVVRGKGPRPILKTGEESFNALGEDLKLTFPNPPLTVRKQMVKYNKFVDNVFTAMDKLGATEAEKEFFRNEILMSFNIANTEREDTM